MAFAGLLVRRHRRPAGVAAAARIGARRGRPAAPPPAALIGAAVRRRRRARPRAARAPLGGHRRSAARRARRPGWRRSPGRGPDRATASAAWPCGACARARRPRRASPSSWCWPSAPSSLADRLRARAARRAAPTSCRSCASPSRCRTCAPWCCCAASCAASSPAPGRGARLEPSVAGRRRPRAVWQRELRGLAALPGRTARADGDARRRRRRAPPSPCSAARRRLVLGVGVALYLLGLDAIEPLSQEIDHPDHTDAVPPRAGLAARAPPRRAGRRAGAVRPDRCGGGRRGRARARGSRALALCVPVTWAARAAPSSASSATPLDPVSPSAATAAVPPEFAGFTSTIRHARARSSSARSPALTAAGDARVARRSARPCGWPCSTCSSSAVTAAGGCAGATSGGRSGASSSIRADGAGRRRA